MGCLCVLRDEEDRARSIRYIIRFCQYVWSKIKMLGQCNVKTERFQFRGQQKKALA